MFKARSIQSSLSFKDKILSIDYILVFSIFVLGLTSILAMYSTDGGEFKYHTNSTFFFFFVCFNYFFYSNKVWHSQSYLIYVCFLYYCLELNILV